MNGRDRLDYAGKYLREYETSRYTFLERQLWLDKVRSIIVPSDAEQFADVSFYQAGMDWDEYAEHARAVILRIGQNIWKDIEFEYNYTEAKRRDLAVGGYFFFDGRATPQQQANVIIDAMPGKSFEMELLIDWERDYGGASEGLPNVVRLMQNCEAAGIQCKAVGMYTGYYWFLEHSNPTTNAAQYTYLRARPLWEAWFASALLVRIPLPWTDWTHWQFGTPVVDWGQPTAEIDMNKHNGTRAEFEARYLSSQPPPTGGTMKGVVNAGYTLTVRDSANADTGKRLHAGDSVYGPVTNNRIYFERIYRSNGNIEQSGGNAATVDPANTSIKWMTLTNEAEPAPPVVTIDSMDVQLAPGSVVTTKYSDGTQKVETA